MAIPLRGRCYLLLSLLLAVLLGACTALPGAGGNTAVDAGNPHLREWVESNTDARYPSTEYLVAIGSAADAETAANNARASLLASFRTHIYSQITVLEREFQQYTRGQEAQITSSSFSSSVLNARAEGSLEGAQVADTAREAATGNWWALVVIHRQTMALNLRRRIDDHNQALASVNSRVRQLLAKQRELRALDLLRPVPAQLAELEAQRSQLGFVLPGSVESVARGMTLGNYVELRQQCVAALTFALSFAVVATDENGVQRSLDAGRLDEAVKGALQESMPGIGVVLAPGLDTLDAHAFDTLSRESRQRRAAGANFLIRGRVNTVFSSRFGSLYVYRSRYIAEVLDLRSGELLVAELAGEGGKSKPHARPDIAASNSLRDVSKALAAAMTARLK